ncbi:MAG TPA: NAD(P)/FAD-dependent oxidoreductase [Dehalococcoidia bacterium]|nr:NAD(P)/FAD-dependent oxidoreductase [Dehalococcoidia bacterium]
MTQPETNSRASNSDAILDFDAIVIGAGVAGLYQLYKLRNIGMRVRVFEAGTGVGGTWYWNRYPGARFDSESYSYGYSFSQELLDEWDWSEHFASQPEILRYLQHVADKFDLVKDIQFSSEVQSAIYSDDTRSWEIRLQDGSRFRSRFLITGIGLLSQPTLPRIPGIDSFKGQSFHTSRWPHEPVSYAGKRVAVIGTGATGVQTIQEVCKDVGHLTVFQRRPNWCAPLHNSKIEPDEMREIRANYEEIFETCNQTAAGFLHTANSRFTFEVSEEERYEFWENLYASKGFGIWQGNFKDVLTDPKANEAMSEFVANKIRQRVDNPEAAEKLIPKDHGFGTRRVPLETRYYESYNRDNVELIDIIDTPIEKITPGGIVTADREFEFDLIIYATGFDAILGSYNKIDIVGVNGRRLKEQWSEELSTFLGIQINNFPNLFMILGPHALLGNNPRSIEFNVEWITDLIEHMTAQNLIRAEATTKAVASWYQHVLEQGEGLLANQIDSWMTGVNSNIDGRQERIVARYSGTQSTFRKRCNEVVESGYTELNLM